MNYKIFILIAILILIGGIFLIQKEKVSEIGIPIEKEKEVEIEKKEDKFF